MTIFQDLVLKMIMMEASVSLSISLFLNIKEPFLVPGPTTSKEPASAPPSTEFAPPPYKNDNETEII